MNTTSNVNIPLARKCLLVLVTTLWAGVLGPLVGGLPFNIFLYPIPFAYLIGGGPALIGGFFFGILLLAWVADLEELTGLRRMALGAVTGAFGCLAAALVYGIAFGQTDALTVAGALCIFGIPAGAVCALLFKPNWVARLLGLDVKARAKQKEARGFTRSVGGTV